MAAVDGVAGAAPEVFDACVKEAATQRMQTIRPRSAGFGASPYLATVQEPVVQAAVTPNPLSID